MRRSITTIAATILAASAVVVTAQGTTSATIAATDNQVRVEAEAITFNGDASAATTSTAAADTACTDTTYATKSWKVSGTLTWLYNGTGVPANISGTALDTIKTASNTVATGANRCGMPANFTTVYAYGGTTTLKPQVDANGACTGNDGKSVTGWGTLPAKTLAYTCTYYNAKGVVVASDTLIDNTAYTWFTSKPANCTGAQYDLQTTLTHERLHTAGLAHVDQTKDAAQVMTPASSPCDISRRLLGAGDYAGLKSING
ncbi:hypothetical protein [Actinokineospora inagensis]|uniref:hypothetical protein n=1 Tax=Actinokineospora inagensis TaxID=103730 RepID=UPI000402FB47|nr:hypothetical protein [Actinokineospora inagensis]